MARAARRGGEHGRGLLYFTSLSGREQAMRVFCAGERCRRGVIAGYFDVEKVDVRCHDCCSVCRRSCSCQLCSRSVRGNEDQPCQEVHPALPVAQRQPLNKDEQERLHGKLVEIHKGFTAHPLPAGPSCPTGLTPALKRKVVDNAHCLSNAVDVERCFAVWYCRQAEEIITAIKSVINP